MSSHTAKSSSGIELKSENYTSAGQWHSSSTVAQLACDMVGVTYARKASQQPEPAGCLTHTKLCFRHSCCKVAIEVVSSAQVAAVLRSCENIWTFSYWKGFKSKFP